MEQRTRAIAIGAAGGLASGLLGIGGGVVMVPLLIAGLAVTQRSAHAISLAAIAPIALVAITVYGATDQVWWTAAAWIAAGAVVGAPIGVRVLRRAPEQALRLSFALVAVVAGLRLVLV